MAVIFETDRAVTKRAKERQKRHCGTLPRAGLVGDTAQCS